MAYVLKFKCLKKLFCAAAFLIPLMVLSCKSGGNLEIEYAPGKAPADFFKQVAKYPYFDEKLDTQIDTVISTIKKGDSPTELRSLLGDPGIELTTFSTSSGENYTTNILVYVIKINSPSERVLSDKLLTAYFDENTQLIWMTLNDKDIVGEKDFKRGMYWVFN